MLEVHRNRLHLNSLQIQPVKQIQTVIHEVKETKCFYKKKNNCREKLQNYKENILVVIIANHTPHHKFHICQEQIPYNFSWAKHANI